MIVAADVYEYARREDGRGGPERLHDDEGAGAAGGDRGGAGCEECGCECGELWAGWQNFWAGAGWHTLHAVQVGRLGWARDGVVGVLTVVAVVQVGSLFSSDAWNNVTFTAGEVRNPKTESAAVAGDRNGRGVAAVYRVQLRLSERAADEAIASGATIAGAASCRAGPRGDGGDGDGVSAPSARS